MHLPPDILTLSEQSSGGKTAAHTKPFGAEQKVRHTMKTSNTGKRSAATLKAILAAALIMASAASMSACGEADAMTDTVTSGADTSAYTREIEEEPVSPDTETTFTSEAEDSNDESGYTDNSTSNYYNSYEYDYEYNENNEYIEYEYDDCSGSNSSDAETDTSAEETVPDIDSDYDYAADAAIRTNVVELQVASPSVGATDAVVKADVINRSGSTITMTGITVYDDMLNPVAANYAACNNDSSEISLEYSLGSDLGLVLERGRTYYYNFTVMQDGQLFTHKTQDFKTISVDDTFAFELCPAEITDALATVSARVSNPTGAQVAIVGCKLYTPQGALMGEQEYGIDTTDQEFTISFDFDNGGEKLTPAKDYEFQVYIRYNGETYTSNYGSFTTLP